MRKTPKDRDFITLQDTEVGMLTGLGGRAVDGYVWDSGTGLRAVHGPRIGSRLLPGDRAGPWLRPVNVARGAVYELYPVLKERKILDDFVAMSRTLTLDAIQRFANRWGLLGRSHVAISRTKQWADTVQAEPLSRWESESLSFRMLWETWEAVRTIKFSDSHSNLEIRAAQALLQERIHWRTKSGRSVSYHAEYEDQLINTSVIASAHVRTDLLELFQHGDVVGPARYYVHEEVNKRLQGHVDLRVLPTTLESQDGRIRFSPNDLLSAIYVHFAVDLAGGRGLERACLSCQQPFLARRRDQEFCDKNCRERAGYHRRKEGGGGNGGKARKR
jgi:hypothetical protein